MSYYEMKNRAGVIGQNGLGPLLGRLAAAGPPAPRPPDGAQLRRPAGLLLAVRPARHGGRRREPGQDPVPDPGRVLPLLLRPPDAVLGRSRPGRAGGRRSIGSTARCCPRSPPPTGPSAGGTRPPACWPTRTPKSLTDLTYQWGGMGHDGYQQSPAGVTIPLAPQGTTTASSPGRSTCSTPTPSSAPTSQRSAARTATSSTRRWSGRSGRRGRGLARSCPWPSGRWRPAAPARPA